MNAETKYQMLRESVDLIVKRMEQVLEATDKDDATEHEDGQHEVAFEVFMELGRVADSIDNIEEMGLRTFPVSNLHPHPETV